MSLDYRELKDFVVQNQSMSPTIYYSLIAAVNDITY